jgi:predicted RNase H-like HicB family nuclease
MAPTHALTVVVEPDEDQWHAYCPALRRHGAVTCGDTKEQALEHIHEVVAMIVEELRAEGTPIPHTSTGSAPGR